MTAAIIILADERARRAKARVRPDDYDLANAILWTFGIDHELPDCVAAMIKAGISTRVIHFAIGEWLRIIEHPTKEVDRVRP